MDDLVNFLKEAKRTARQYFLKFRDVWDEVSEQVRCVHPNEWNKKEDWQTKVFIPMQSKTIEIAKAHLKRTLLGAKRFFNIELKGVEEDRDRDNALEDLIEIILEQNDFYKENDFVFEESSIIGTSAMKVLMLYDQIEGYKYNYRFQFIHRTPYQFLIDPACGKDYLKARYFIDRYKKSIDVLIREAKSKKYDLPAIGQLLEELRNLSSSASERDLEIVKSIDGTENIKIAKQYKFVDLDEFWGYLPNENRPRVITMLNDKYIIRNEYTSYFRPPFFLCRVKPRLYDVYGLGFLENTRDIQKLANSIINLWFDSVKLSIFKILKVDITKVADPNSIEIKPKAVWMLNDINAVQSFDLGTAGVDGLNAFTLLDQIHQDTTGITRHIQGTAPPLSKGMLETETLGEYQLKLQLADQRFLDIAKFIEKDYLVPLIKFLAINIIRYFPQEEVNRYLGVKPDKTPRLDIEKIRNIPDEYVIVSCIGLTQFTQKVERQEKLRTLLQLILNNPPLTAMSKLYNIYRRVLQEYEFEDIDELIKSPDEIKELLASMATGGQTTEVPLPTEGQGEEEMLTGG